MPNTYSQIHIHVVFVVKNRRSLIKKEWKDSLYKYITGIIQKNGHKLLAIGGVEDHVHALIGLRPTQSLSDLMQDVKGDSSKWINNNKLINGRFSWQESYGAFSYSKSNLPNVINYINTQEEHHRKKNFYDEYIKLLEEFEIDYDIKYLFEPVI